MKTIVVLMIAGIGMVLSSCNTVAGAGQDMQRAGGAVSNAARDAAR